jgi:hypothetical protein
MVSTDRGETSRRSHTVNVVHRCVDKLLIAHRVGPSALAHSSNPSDDILKSALVLSELSAELLDHAVDIVELGLLSHLGRQADHGARGHIGSPVHAVHDDEMRRRKVLRRELMLAKVRELLRLGRLQRRQPGA